MDSYLDSSHQAKGPPNMVPNRVAGGAVHSSSSSGIFFSADAQSQVLGNSLLSSSFGNSSNVIPGLRGNLGPLSGDVSNMVLNSVASSGPSVGGSSLVTDANSGLSGGPHFQRSASFNTDSYMRLPASPLSFSSNNISISGSSIVDGSSVAHPNSNQDPNSQQSRQGQLQPGPSSAASLPASRGEQIQHPNDTGSFLQDQAYFSQLQKKPRLDIKQEDVLPQQVLQQMLQRQDSLHLQNPNSQLQALIQQQRLRQQQQQILQSMSPTQRAHLIQQQQLQLRQQGVQPSPAMKRPYDGGVCSRRLMQYLYHQRQRPPDNSIAYWRKFVAEYYSPRAKKRWCLSLYDNVGHHSLGVFPQAAMDAWQCDICGSKSGRGFEATFEVLPRLNEIKFGSGVIDELLFLDLPRECRFPSGIMMLEYAKAVQESVYEQLRVVREGQLRIIFAADLKILSWEFCAQRHEELLPRRVVEPQVKQALQVAQKCQNAISEIGPDGVSQQDLQTTSNMIVAAGRQLNRNLDSQALNDLGFSKRYVRCLQIAEVVNSTKDIMDYCKDQKVGPIEALKTFAKRHQPQKMQEMDQQLGGGTQSLSGDKSSVNKLTVASHSGLNSPIANSPQMPGIETVNGSGPQSDIALSNYLNLLMRQNSTNSNRNPVQQQQQEAPSSTNSSNHNPSIGNVQGSGLSGFHMEPQRYLQGNALQTQMNMQHAQGNDGLQQRMIQQLMQEMRNHGGNGVQQQQQQQQHYITGQNTTGVVSRNGFGFGFGNGTLSGGISTGNGSNGPVNNNNNNMGAMPSRSNSFKATSNSETSAGGVGNSEFNNKAAQNVNLLEGLPDVARDFTENGFLDDDNMSFDWKV